MTELQILQEIYQLIMVIGAFLIAGFGMLVGLVIAGRV